jgi:hypothetical protein
MIEPKRPGRPSLDAETPSMRVQVALPSRVFDEAQRLASRTGVSVPEVLRRGLARVLADPPGE